VRDVAPASSAAHPCYRAPAGVAVGHLLIRTIRGREPDESFAHSLVGDGDTAAAARGTTTDFANVHGDRTRGAFTGLSDAPRTASAAETGCADATFTIAASAMADNPATNRPIGAQGSRLFAA
jgi:hypothetical protein